jgi:hypothetical protein
MKLSRMSPSDWTKIEPALRYAIAAQIPDWTDASPHDPGITVLELLAYLLDAAVSYSTIDHERAATAVARISDAASRLEVPETADVTVDGDRWTRAARLDDVGPEDRVFSLDAEGRVVFGDGVHGRRPVAGSRIAYRSGAGADGNVGVTVRTTWPLPRRRCDVEVDAAGAISIRCGRDPA